MLRQLKLCSFATVLQETATKNSFSSILSDICLYGFASGFTFSHSQRQSLYSPFMNKWALTNKSAVRSTQFCLKFIMAL